MEGLKTAFYFLAVLSVLVIVHEWGHFIVAKLCRMRVEDFSLFFGKVLYRIGERNGTVYNIRAIPLGGFVKIAGMEPEDLHPATPVLPCREAPGRRRTEKFLQGLNPDALSAIHADNVSDRVRQAVQDAIGPDSLLTDTGRQELQTLLHSTGINSDEHRYIEAILGARPQPPDPDGYNQKPIWQRAAVIFAGPFMSLMFGYALFCVMGFTTGLPMPDFENPTNVVERVSPDKPGARAGLRQGDQIIEINGRPITQGRQMIETIHRSAGVPLTLKVRRGAETLTLNVVPEPGEIEDEQNGRVVKKKVGLIGFIPRPVVEWKRFGVADSIATGTRLIYVQLTETPKILFSKRVKDNVGGPVAIVSKVHEDSQEGPRHVLFTAALLSVSLCIFNLLPIPVLDGGHLMLLFIEFVRRRKLSTREVYAAQMLGLSIIGALFLLVTYNDIARILFRTH